MSRSRILSPYEFLVLTCILLIICFTWAEFDALYCI